jgi:uridylate kinase
MDNGLPIYVFNMADEGNVGRIVSGERVGTLVTAEPSPAASPAAQER